MFVLGLLVDLAIAFGAAALLSRLGSGRQIARIRRWLAASVLVDLGLIVVVGDTGD